MKRIATALATIAVVLAGAAVADARPAGAGKGNRPNILVVMTDDMALDRPAVHAEDQPAAGRQGHDLRRRGRFVPALLPGPRDLHHRPVRPQPRGRGQLRAVRLVRDEAPGNTLPAWLDDAGYKHRDDRQVAERLRRPRRPRRGPGGLRHLARAARRLRLRLLQLRHEPRRQAQDVGRQGVRPQARQVRQHRGRRRAGHDRHDLRQPDQVLRRRRPSPTGAARSPRLLARRHRPGRPAPGPPRAQRRASPSSSGGRRRRPIARTSRPR